MERIDSTQSSAPLATTSQEANKNNKLEKESAPIEDRVTLSEPGSAGQTYGPGFKVGSAYDLLRNLVIKTLQDQGVQVQVSTGDTTIDLTTLSPEEAQNLISDDGYFGVEKTSQRIVDFAINAFGGDPARLQEMKDAIDQGFAAAQDAFGGELPEISQQTYEAIMDKLDAFATQFGNNEE